MAKATKQTNTTKTTKQNTIKKPNFDRFNDGGGAMTVIKRPSNKRK